MTQYTPNYGFPYPELTDAPDGATQMEALAAAIDSALDTVDSTLSSSLTSSTSASAIRTALFGNATAVYFQNTNSIPTSSTNTTYADLLDSTGGRTGVVFVAPPSGKVEIKWGGNFRYNSGTTGQGAGFVGANVGAGATLGSGLVNGIVDAEASEIPLFPGGAQTVGLARTRVVTGLTAGSTYNAWIAWRSSQSITRDALGAWVAVVPLPV